MIQNKKSLFIKAIRDSLEDESFIRLSLNGYKGQDKDLKKILVRKIIIKKIFCLSFTYRYKTRDIIKNYLFEEALEKISDFLSCDFHDSTLYTTDYDTAYPSLKKSTPTQKRDDYVGHDRIKKYFIKTKEKPYLKALRITDQEGNVLKSAQDKFRQINKYIEILDAHTKDLLSKQALNIVDMGAGKGYLTFALYDHLSSQRLESVFIQGVEYRKDLVKLCNRIAKESGFYNLSFVQGSIEDYALTQTDILIALHACDTATDDAIAKGVEAGASLIVVAPCCQKQIRKQMEKATTSSQIEFMTRHGIFMERQAEMITDSLRAIILEYVGYDVKVFEFVSGEHTAKNIMIVASKKKKDNSDKKSILQTIQKIKKDFGIDSHALEKIIE